MGGNLYKIKHYDNWRMDNLHFVWDEMFMPYNTSIRTNLSPEQYLFIDEWSKEIQAEYTLEDMKSLIEKNNNQKAWGDESYGIAKSFAYTGIYEGQELPQSYQEMGRKYCRQRVAIGGYRLGITLDAIYKHINSQANSAESEYIQGLISFIGESPNGPEFRLQINEEADAKEATQ